MKHVTWQCVPWNPGRQLHW